LACPSHFWRFETQQKQFHFGILEFVISLSGEIFLSPVNCVFKSLEVQLRGTCVRGALFGEISAGKKKRKKRLEFLFVGTGGARRGGQRQKGSKGKGRGEGGGPLKMHHAPFVSPLFVVAAPCCCCNKREPKKSKKQEKKQKNKAPPRTAAVAALLHLLPPSLALAAIKTLAFLWRIVCLQQWILSCAQMDTSSETIKWQQ
jgi:hypothetical protein